MHFTRLFLNFFSKNAVLLLSACALPAPFFAQRGLEIQLPDLEITADHVERGDGDTYGLGDWRCMVRARLEGARLIIDGQISFYEKANDFTTITGGFHKEFAVPELENCSYCAVAFDELNGSAGGPNIGARGFQWFGGRGVVRGAKIQTDTFGDDAGHIGGILRFEPLRAIVRCDYVLVD